MLSRALSAVYLPQLISRARPRRLPRRKDSATYVFSGLFRSVKFVASDQDCR